nr:type IVB secretion system protein IcmH/DotU [uncultured Pseudomonas sp.]
MNRESEYAQDEKTVLLDRDGVGPAQGPLTDAPSPPRFEQLEDRMIYTARLQEAQRFNMGPNVLLAAAWELLSQVVQLKASAGRENLQALNERLSSGVAMFEAHALQQGGEAGQVMSARYVLCSVIDEAVVTTAWGSRSEWPRISLLSRFHNETFGGEKFFQLLERLSRDPFKHVAMLELMYLCLSIGFEGKYRVMERGGAQLDSVRDALYRQIKHVRGDRPSMAAPSGAAQGRHSRIRMLSTPAVVAVGLAAVLAMYLGFAWVLGKERMTVLQPLQLLASAQARTPL